MMEDLIPTKINEEFDRRSREASSLKVKLANLRTTKRQTREARLADLEKRIIPAIWKLDSGCF